MEKNDLLQHLRLTNTAPTSQDKAFIYSIISEIDNDILQVDESITTLERELQKLKSTRAERIQRRSDYTNLLTPIRSLPMEILGEIFLYASAGSISARVRVSHVCQRWRSAALSTSELWLTMPRQSGPLRGESRWDYFQACVSRAQFRPLILDNYIRRNPLHHDAPLSFIKVAAATPRCRWKECSWTSLEVDFFEPLIELLASTSRDTLESLTLESRPRDWPQDLASQLPVINFILKSGFKHLSTLSLTMEFEPLHHVIFDAPWPQLKELSLFCQEANEDTIFKILGNCLELEECTISMDCFDQPLLYNPNRLRPIPLAKLRQLQLYNSEDLFSGITGVLVTPVLEELALYLEEEEEEYPSIITHPDVYRFLLANAENLRSLCISGISEDRVRDTIIQLRHLEELTILLPSNERHIALNALTVRIVISSFISQEPVESIPLPRLRSLSILSDATNLYTQEAFIELVESRWWPTSNDEELQWRPFARLRYASLQDISNVQRRIWGNIARLRTEGLDIDFPA